MPSALIVIKASSIAVKNHKVIALLVVLAGFFFALPLLLVAHLFSLTDQGQNGSLSPEVLAHAPAVFSAAHAFGIPEYQHILLAIMMQESGGAGTDPMQSSESEYNTRFPRTPGGITDPSYSIHVGVQYFAECLRVAGTKGVHDTQNLYLALQGYNFGKGYITWAIHHHGTYSPENAQQFSDIKKQQLGWSVYGDPQYVAHVMRYVSLSSSQLPTGGFILPVENPVWGSPFGMRASGMHYGQDFPMPVGTPVYAVADGQVMIAQRWNGGVTGSNSWGNYLKLAHSDTLYTLYAHLSSLVVVQGALVKQGTLIGFSGNTGRSTGPHLHFEVYDGGEATSFRKDPKLYLPNNN